MSGVYPARAPRCWPWIATRAGHVAAGGAAGVPAGGSAPKPGNVSPGRHFADLRFEDFLASAAAIGAPFAGAVARSVGATVRQAVEATAPWTRSNTNLGIVLLLAPLAHAASLRRSDSTTRVRRVAERSVLRTAVHAGA